MEPFHSLPEFVTLEHQVQTILTQQEQHGWHFDTDAARQFALALTSELREIEETLRRRHPFVDGGEWTPKRNNSRQGYVEGASLCRLKETNPSSRDHQAWILQQFYGWKPSQLTATGKCVIDETVLKEVNSEMSLAFLRILTITKMLGLLKEGNNAYLKLVTNADRIHHHCSVATNTHRCAHRNPNLGQVPSDERFRRLFLPSPGQVMVGADLSGIELRLLAHYLARYDGGRYAKILLEDDIHQVNADKIGISRRQVKTVTYAFLYGAGDVKIGLSYDPQLSAADAKRKGKDIRAAYVDAVDGLGELLDAVQKVAEKGSIKAIDGRKIKVDSTHKALNYLLQSSAGVIAKRWMVIVHNHIKQLGICASQLCFLHDELQFECAPEHTNDHIALVHSSLQSGEYYNLRIPVRG